MAKLSKHVLDANTAAAEAYHQALAGSPAEEYLASRGLLDAAEEFMLGWVDRPAPGHEDRFIHTLSVPYVTTVGVVSFKFRRLDDSTPKYDQPHGQKQHLYNVNAVLDAASAVCLVEGELDAVASTLAGRPACAVPGANGWKHMWRRCFDGLTVKVVTDNDGDKDHGNPGQELARRICEDIPSALRVVLPVGHDVNSYIQQYGAHEFTALVDSV